MEKHQVYLSIAIILAMAILGYFIRETAISFKEFERTVTVKGLAEQEHPADVVIWPIQFTETGNNLEEIYVSLETSANIVKQFLIERGIEEEAISFSTPNMTDKSAQRYGGNENYEFRYVAAQNVTVYSKQVNDVRKVMGQLVELGKKGITLSGDEYQVRTEYLFTRLNDIKPEMIEQATKEARQVAQKFAEDSNSKLGKIKTASQGQFSISDRDNNTPYIKNIRVVSTIEYYLSD
ncbi:SIMPL domain-containing protein [Aliifodinibius sp. S!AR15-10]|uniref:SIMPL domain-containing protein n=1 Tax=Aliifodinibius sp. S!AR15-10 TaxID=2950437 RepID=UPI00285DA2B7|nr:SIMPL domain-containing protein [Aliifodinibius sp. S!AR15-10]MDR8392911.1 SIMPL domain-containing protein [Aliifodinibius sp. S!AR15-10]